MNHRFLLSVLTDDFQSHDLRLTASNLRKERDPEKRTEILDHIDTESVTQRLMELLDIRNKEEQSIGITDTHIREIKEYLSALELIVNCPIEPLTQEQSLWNTSCLPSRGCDTVRHRLLSTR